MTQPEELTITLRSPVKLGEASYTHLTLREPTGAQWMEVDKIDNGVESDIKLIALVSGVPEPAVKQIGARDLRQAAKYLASFFI